ncbi:hypothetical protein MVEN_02563600 [Mycena venus]|uniref:Uncharacterized protein n=1 Tax=Mycena venus TaxID=2733690 RepID=A0A8H6U3Q4_9AGAR|nr:hypothetical protein MVEN_02563600 [Mycena venus]
MPHHLSNTTIERARVLRQRASTLLLALMTQPNDYIPPPDASISCSPSLLQALRYRKAIEILDWKYMPAALAVIRLLDSEDVGRFSNIIIPLHLRPTPTFLLALSDTDRIAALRACLLIFTVTRIRKNGFTTSLQPKHLVALGSRPPGIISD